MKLVTTCLLLLFVINVNAQELMANLSNQKDLVTNNKFVINDPIIHNLHPKKELHLDLNFGQYGSSDYGGRPILMGAGAGLLIGLPWGIFKQIKKGSADCSNRGITAHWTDCILGPHPLLRNMLIWGGLGLTIGYTASF